MHPQFQRKGVGALLVRHGQTLALQDEVILLIESSKSALKLYKREGFCEIWKSSKNGIDDVGLVWCPDVNVHWKHRSDGGGRGEAG